MNNNVHVTNFTKNNKCSNCGQCCTDFLPLSSKEIKNIKHYIKVHNIKEQRHNVAAGIDITCPFRDEKNKKCLIYEVRPEICKRFICNDDKEKIFSNKRYFINKYNPVFMRSEFFNNSEDANMLKIYLNLF